MNTNPKRKIATKKSSTQKPIKKEDLIALFEYSVSPSITQAKVVAKSLVCASFVGLGATGLAKIECSREGDWIAINGKNLLPTSESSVLSMMSDLEEKGLSNWDAEEIERLPKKVLETLRLDRDLKEYLIETKESLVEAGEINQYRAKHKIKKDLEIEASESSFVDIFVKRVTNGLSGYESLIHALTNHAGKSMHKASSIASSLESFEF